METQVLDLSGNNLQILPREVFARHGLLNLQRLHLADCRIGQIDQTAFRGLTNLVELNLAGNLLTSVPIATFSGKILRLTFYPKVGLFYDSPMHRKLSVCWQRLMLFKEG